MEKLIPRRDFIHSTSAAGAAAFLGHKLLNAPAANAQAAAPAKPVVIASGNGLQATAKAMSLMQQGADALDAVIAGVNILEDDPNENSVGLGGLPNEDGVVELDASVMHGPTGRGGSVASLRNIRNPSKVARLVMERTDHVLIVGEGALRFAKAHGFKEEDLLTDESRRAWLKWKEDLSRTDDWLPPHDLETKNISLGLQSALRNHGTI
ncbi:MAG: isoaspartyl peptidase/L-asparaginase, partial [Verrucomicrobia bacterium]|nr:isoaspartyl peptidase/L-asparaginase [Verrucomicrobiota bacterium]